MRELEKYAILETLEARGGSTTKTAEMLGISIRTVQYRLHQYGVRGPSSSGSPSSGAGSSGRRHVNA